MASRVRDPHEPVLYPEIHALDRIYSGKVRDTYGVGDDRLLLVASDRISAFDCILPTGIPDKGRVLTGLSAFWFARTAGLVQNHLLSSDWREIASLCRLPMDQHLAGRTLLVRRAQRIDVECVVRGYLAGSGWEEYRSAGTLAGLPLPPGLRECEQLPEPAFTPAIKNDQGHDQNVSVAQLGELVGTQRAQQLAEISLTLYTFAGAYARTRGIIVADTKFEFGLVGDSVILIDEALTPDSSRFWPADHYAPGKPQPSYDKQPVRDYLARSGWDRQPPAPPLPHEVVEATVARYRTAYRVLTGAELDG